MLKKISYIISVLFLLFAIGQKLPSYAQFFSDEEEGGKVTCRFSGGVEEYSKKISLTGENLIVIDSDFNTVEFNFLGDTKLKGEEISLLLFAPLVDVGSDLFTSDENFNTSLTGEAELSLLRYEENGDVETEITNLSDNNEVDMEDAVVIVEVKSFRDKRASGNIKVRFPETVSIINHNNEETTTGNGKVVVTCEFLKVPVTLE